MSTKSTEKKISAILSELSDNQIFEGILKKAAYLGELNVLLGTLLDKEMVEHCCVANFRDNILVIQCENAAWATRFKFLIPELLKTLRRSDILPSLVSISLIIEHHH